MPDYLRIHIAPIGYNYKRVTEPLIKKDADKVYLLRHITENQRGHDNFYKAIKKDLKTTKITIDDTVMVDIFDLYDCLEKIREIIRKENGNHIFINVSSGSKITAMAGMMACMIWGATPYYARLKYKEKTQQVPKEEKLEKTEELPAYKIKKPDKSSMKILKILAEKNGSRTKSGLIKDLVTDGTIPKKLGGDETVGSHKHSRLRPILKSLIEQKFVETVALGGPKSEVRITAQGEKALRIFGLEDFETIEI